MKKIIINISVLILVLAFNACKYNYDSDDDLVRPDGYKGSYLTPLGCLVNGPWTVSEIGKGYNVKLILDGEEISSVGVPYTILQQNLVFELHKNGSLTYWLKSENGYSWDNIDSVFFRTKHKKSPGESDIKKVYNDGYWKVNFKDSTVLIHFENKNIPELNYKFSYLSNGSANFQESYSFDSIYYGKKVVMKRVNNIFYETLYPRF